MISQQLHFIWPWPWSADWQGAWAAGWCPEICQSGQPFAGRGPWPLLAGPWIASESSKSRFCGVSAPGGLASTAPSAGEECGPCALQRVRQQGVLTAHEGDLVQLIPPLLGNYHPLLGHFLALNGVPLLIRVWNKLRDVWRVQRVQDIEEILPVGHPPLRQLVREEIHELALYSHLWPEGLHWKLVIQRDVNPPDFRHLHQFFVARQNRFQKILVHGRFLRQIQLTAKDVNYSWCLLTGYRGNTVQNRLLTRISPWVHS